MTDIDEYYMQQALDLATNAIGRVSPNPLVGAVLVNDGRIVAHGWHLKAGSNHAEVHALNMAGDLALHSTLYVTLEPCAHYGKTPPCVEAIIKAGVQRVVVGTEDPNPLVSGKGIERLRSHGIEITVGVLEEKAKKLNEVFFTCMLKKRPFVALKFAMSLDGKIATYKGTSKWITGEGAREKGHCLRDIYDAILVGSLTVRKDNPSLTTRLEENKGKNPTRIILASKGDIPLNSNVCTDQLARTIVVVTKNALQKDLDALKKCGAEVLVTPSNSKGQIDLPAMLAQLQSIGITSLLVEGGSNVHFSFLKENLVDKIYAFLAPKIIGGKDALSVVGGEGFAGVDDCNGFLFSSVQILADGNLFLIAER